MIEFNVTHLKTLAEVREFILELLNNGFTDDFGLIMDFHFKSLFVDMGRGYVKEFDGHSIRWIEGGTEGLAECYIDMLREERWDYD